VTVLLLDDHALFRQSLARALKDNLPEVTFVEAGNQAEALAHLAAPGYDLVLLDLNLGPVSGLSVLGALRAIKPDLKTLVVSMHRDGHHVATALKAKVQGFVTKDGSVEGLVAGVKAVLSGQSWFSPELLQEASRFLSLPSSLGTAPDGAFQDYRSLTGREQEVFLKLAEGKTVDEIARSLGRSPKTVENHRSAIYQKLGLGDRYELLVFARNLGLIL